MNEDFQKELQEVSRVFNDTTKHVVSLVKEQIDSLAETVLR